MLFFDAPEHTRLRKLMNKGFSPVAIESLRPQIEKIVHRLLMPLRNNHRMDILPQFAHPLPTYVIAELLSVPDLLPEMFIRWSIAVATVFWIHYRIMERLVARHHAVHDLTS